MRGDTAIKTIEVAALRIRVVRGTRVILDADLAELYDVETRVLTQAVRRNPDRFPEEQRYDAQFAAIIQAIRVMTAPPSKKRHPVGFGRDDAATD